MNGLDWLVVAVLGLSVFSGFVRGLFRTLLGLLGWILAAVVAFRYGDDLADALFKSITSPALRTAIAMTVLFLLVGLIMAAFSALCARVIRAAGLGASDRLLGAAFGAVRGFAFVILATVAAGFTTLPQSHVWRGSFFGPRLEAWAMELRPYLPPSLADLIHFRADI